jgi:hypothetical protein
MINAPPLGNAAYALQHFFLIEISVVQDSPHREDLGRRQRILEKIIRMEQQTTAKLKRLDVRLEDRSYDWEVKAASRQVRMCEGHPDRDASLGAPDVDE